MMNKISFKHIVENGVVNLILLFEIIFYKVPASDSENKPEINFLLDLEELLKNYPKVDKKLELEQVC